MLTKISNCTTQFQRGDMVSENSETMESHSVKYQYLATVVGKNKLSN